MWLFTPPCGPACAGGLMGGSNPDPLVAPALVVCSRLRNVLVMTFSRMKTLVLLLKVSSYQAVVMKHCSLYHLSVSLFLALKFLFFLIDTCRCWQTVHGLLYCCSS